MNSSADFRRFHIHMCARARAPIDRRSDANLPWRESKADHFFLHFGEECKHISKEKNKVKFCVLLVSHKMRDRLTSECTAINTKSKKVEVVAICFFNHFTINLSSNSYTYWNEAECVVVGRHDFMRIYTMNCNCMYLMKIDGNGVAAGAKTTIW